MLGESGCVKARHLFLDDRYDRFARSLRQQLVNALEEFRLGIDFVSLHEGVDTSTPSGRLVPTVAESSRPGFEIGRKCSSSRSMGGGCGKYYFFNFLFGLASRILNRFSSCHGTPSDFEISKPASFRNARSLQSLGHKSKLGNAQN